MRITISQEQSLSRRKPWISSDPKDYLVVEDPMKVTTWHLPVSRKGVVDRRLLGDAHAALFSNFRGNPYSGPQKEKAKKKILAIYKKLGITPPSAEK